MESLCWNLSFQFNIVGNSGCEITLINSTVKKMSPNLNYNKRLLNQCIKQKQFASNILRSPKVYKEGLDHNRFFFEMELVTCKTFDSFFITATKQCLDNVAEKIILFIKSNISGTMILERDIIVNKFEKTKKDIRIKKNIDLSYLNETFYSLNQNLQIPSGYCHGDLTFSNLLFEGEGIVALDFLDTYLDTPLQDLVKLKQDTNYFWSLKRLKNHTDKLKIKQCLRYIDQKIDLEFSNYPYYEEYYRVFQILNLMRIIPYCKLRADIDFLTEKINHLWRH